MKPCSCVYERWGHTCEDIKVSAQIGGFQKKAKTAGRVVLWGGCSLRNSVELLRTIRLLNRTIKIQFATFMYKGTMLWASHCLVKQRRPSFPLLSNLKGSDRLCVRGRGLLCSLSSVF